MKSRAVDMPVDAWVRDHITQTHGRLYAHCQGRLSRYPIPAWSGPRGQGGLLLDLGAGWGRWSLSAAQAGYRVIALDRDPEALQAARRVARQFGWEILCVCGDAARLPLRSASVEAVFAYGVHQYLPSAAEPGWLEEIRRVLQAGGWARVQLPMAGGLGQRLWPRRDATAYLWPWRQARMLCRRYDARIFPEGFFTTNGQWSDRGLLRWPGRLVVLACQALRALSRILPGLSRLADAIWLDMRMP